MKRVFPDSNGSRYIIKYNIFWGNLTLENNLRGGGGRKGAKRDRGNPLERGLD